MIRRILVPTDFSDISANALKYAAQLADYVEAKEIYVVHVFTPQTAPDAVVIPPVEELMQERRRSLDLFLERQQPQPGRLQYSHDLQLGFAADEIVDLSEEYDLIVMGTTGEAGVLERLFGSTSTAVAQRAHCPVLLVPGQAAFYEYRHILYSSNDLSISRKAVLKFIEFNDLFRARVHFVHINGGDNDPYRGEREKLFATLFSGPEPEFAFDITEIKADDTVEGLQEYMENNPVDLAILVTRHRGFWEGFFHRSTTKHLALSAKLPLMVFHVED